MARPESPFVQMLTEHNLSTYFLLPLIQLNKFSFGAGNFIDSYVNPSGTVLTVELIDLRLCESFQSHAEYLNEEQTTNAAFIWFDLPARWFKDFVKFKHGQYSKFSEDAKAMIITYSGLTYQKQGENGQPITDARLLALDRSPILRDRWFEELGKHTTILPEDLELLSIPHERTFREYECPEL